MWGEGLDVIYASFTSARASASNVGCNRSGDSRGVDPIFLAAVKSRGGPGATIRIASGTIPARYCSPPAEAAQTATASVGDMKTGSRAESAAEATGERRATEHAWRNDNCLAQRRSADRREASTAASPGGLNPKECGRLATAPRTWPIA